MSNYEFSLVPGVFEYDYDDVTKLNEEREEEGKDPIPPTLKRLPRLGLRTDFDKSTRSVHENESSPWARIRDYVDILNEEAADGANHKVIFVIRHGYSLHNYIEKGVIKRQKVDGVEKEMVNHWRDGVKIAFKEQVSLGTLRDAFEEAGHELSTDLADHFGIKMDANAWTETIPLLDSKLLPKEVAKRLRGSGAKNNDVGDLGNQLLKWAEEETFPLPDVVYTSPLSRCLETTEKVYRRVFESEAARGRKFGPVIKENLREKLNGDACNYRGHIKDRVYKFALEPNFSPEDLHKDDIEKAETGATMESNGELEWRMKGVLTGIFDEDKGSVVSLTTHSYSIGALTEAMKCNYKLDEGDIAAFLVKAVPVQHGTES
ncbi:hypothetical protein PG985_011224 [Apiospora marii]|uniref:uncharacterized protein n=1 Tax=Apiospora marii TaxID=335849 RepID=UPI00312E1EE5